MFANLLLVYQLVHILYGFVRIRTYVVPHSMYVLAFMYVHIYTQYIQPPPPTYVETRQSCSISKICMRWKWGRKIQFYHNCMPAPRPNPLFFGAKYRDGGILHAACARTVDQEKACLTQTGYIQVEPCTGMANSALLPDFFPFKSGHMLIAKVAVMILFHGDGILSRFKTVNFRLEKRGSHVIFWTLNYIRLPSHLFLDRYMILAEVNCAAGK